MSDIASIIRFDTESLSRAIEAVPTVSPAVLALEAIACPFAGRQTAYVTVTPSRPGMASLKTWHGDCFPRCLPIADVPAVLLAHW